jgi:superfamily II DNA/RNA helicase
MTSHQPPRFSALGLCDSLVRATHRAGYDEPTPVQCAVIPAALRGEDVWASAKTGSGKTAAFVLPLLQLHANAQANRHAGRTSHPIPVHALLLVPTRELALQIGKAVSDLGAYLPSPPKTIVAVGGVSINPQMLALRGGADIVVATPGRLLDLVEHHALSLSSVQVLVLDEAERLLALGFQAELLRILALLPTDNQRWMFSATFPPAVRALAESHLLDPTQINIDAGAIPDASAIAQRVIQVDAGRRTSLLQHLLHEHGWSSVLVFVASKHDADQVAGKLQRAGLAAAALHGDMSQGTRTGVLAAFKERRLQVLVATDLAARGLDIVELAAVVNYDLPRSAADYLHRIGRTGRAGSSGVAVSFINGTTLPHFQLIERRHRISLAREVIPGFEPVEKALPPSHPHGGVKGKRKSKKDKLREAAARAAAERDR